MVAAAVVAAAVVAAAVVAAAVVAGALVADPEPATGVEPSEQVTPALVIMVDPVAQ